MGKINLHGFKKRLERIGSGTPLSAHATFFVKGETSHLIC